MKNADIISHWHLLIDKCNASVADFYRSVEEALNARQVPDLDISRVTHSESGFGSAKREYLRIRRRGLTFDLCAAPFGRGFFVSWWLVKLPPRAVVMALLGFLGVNFVALRVVIQAPSIVTGLILLMAAWFVVGLGVRDGMIPGEDTVIAMPVVGWLYQRLFSPTTYYQLDTAYMFQESVRSAVQEVIDELRSGQGLRALSNEECRPVMSRLTGE